MCYLIVVVDLLICISFSTRDFERLSMHFFFAILKSSLENYLFKPSTYALIKAVIGVYLLNYKNILPEYKPLIR